jgi:hypothetical protein
VGEAEGCLARLQVFVKYGVESGASAELSVEMQGSRSDIPASSQILIEDLLCQQRRFIW